MSSSVPGVEVNSSFDPSSEWKQEANSRLAAHRARRGGRSASQSALPGMEVRGGGDPSLRPKGKSVADRVAARYAQAPTYREMLAAEARNASRAADAAAVAAGEARDAAQAILVGLDVDQNEGLYFEDHESRAASTERSPALTSSPAQTVLLAQPAIHEMDRSMPEESASGEFSGSGFESFSDVEPISPVQPLPAKLLEFPRELVAARKARPRLAEGPLREEYDRAPAQSQLRIFEVETEAISTQPSVEPVLPGWSSIRLDSAPIGLAASIPADTHRDSRTAQQRSQDADRARLAKQSAISGFELPLQTASLEDRLMAGLVDVAVIVAAFLGFVFVFAACTAHPPTGKPALIGAFGVLFAFAMLYQVLFFNFGHDTPGMRYAKIALCTFDDENPTRQVRRRRIAALLLSASPLTLGILWAFFDDDRLGWHDRISRTYQRSYR